MEKETAVIGTRLPQPTTDLLCTHAGIPIQCIHGRTEFEPGKDGRCFGEQADSVAAKSTLSEQPRSTLADTAVLLALYAMFERIEAGDETGVHRSGRRRHRKTALIESEVLRDSIEARRAYSTVRRAPRMVEAQAIDGDQQKVDDALGAGGRSGQRATRGEGPDSFHAPIPFGDEVIVQHRGGVAIAWQQAQAFTKCRPTCTLEQTVDAMLC